MAASALSGAAAVGPLCITASNPLNATKEYFPQSMRISADGSEAGAATVKIAGDFAVTYHPNFKVVETFCQAHSPYSCKPKMYILSICGAAKPTAFPNGTAIPSAAAHFAVPLTGLAVGSGAQVTFIEMLGLLDRVQVVDPTYVHSPCLQKLEEEALIVGQKTGANWTKLLENHPTVSGVFTDSYGTGKSDSAKDIVFDATTDPGAMARAEWIKFMSVFFNEEDKANLYFDKELAAFTATSAATAAVAAATTPKTCAWVSLGWGDVYTLSFTKYKTDYCKAAGMVPVTNATLLAAGTYTQKWNKWINKTAGELDVDAQAAFHNMLKMVDVVGQCTLLLLLLSSSLLLSFLNPPAP